MEKQKKSRKEQGSIYKWIDGVTKITIKTEFLKDGEWYYTFHEVALQWSESQLKYLNVF